MKKNENKLILILGMMMFLANGDNYAVASLLDNIATDLNILISSAALSVTAYMFSFGVFTLFFGPLSDKFGKARIINISAFGTAIFSIMGAFAFNLESLIFFRAVNGVFGAGITPVTMALIGQSFGKDTRQKALSSVMALGFLGSAAATFLGGVLTYFGSWRTVYFVYGIAELFFAILMYINLEKDTGKQNKLRIISSYTEVLANKKLIQLMLTLLFVGMAVFGSFAFAGELIRIKTNYSISIIGLILSLFGIGNLVGARYREKLRDRIKQYHILLSAILGAIGLIILSSTQSIVLICLALFIYGFSFINIQPTIINLAQEQFPNKRGTVMSLASFSAFGGGAVASFINSNIVLYFNINLVFILASIYFIIIGLVYFLIVENSMRKTELLYVKK